MNSKPFSYISVSAVATQTLAGP